MTYAIKTQIDTHTTQLPEPCHHHVKKPANKVPRNASIVLMVFVTVPLLCFSPFLIHYRGKYSRKISSGSRITQLELPHAGTQMTNLYPAICAVLLVTGICHAAQLVLSGELAAELTVRSDELLAHVDHDLARRHSTVRLEADHDLRDIRMGHCETAVRNPSSLLLRCLTRDGDGDGRGSSDLQST